VSTDLAAKARAIIDGNQFMTLGTANADGDPWASPVFYVADGYSQFYWVSSPQATQVRNIAVRPRVGIVVFNSQQVPGSGEAVYLAATARELSGPEFDRWVEIYLGRAPFGRPPEDMLATGPYRAYGAFVTEHSMLCPQASREPCPVHGRTSDHRMAVTL
jgi:uncharacterized protein YhbP (UPF0306 family)